MPATLRHVRPRAAPKMQLAPAWSCMATLSPCQHVREIKAAAAGAGCQLVSGHSPPGHVSPGHLFRERVYDSDTIAVMALAVYTIRERRSIACATKVKS